MRFGKIITKVLTALVTAVAFPAMGQSPFETYAERLKSAPDRTTLAQLLNEPYENYVSRPDDAAHAFAAGRTAAARLGEKEMEARFCDKLGVVHYLAGRYDSSTHYATLAIHQFEEINLPREAARIQCGLGHQMKRRNLSEAFKHFRKGIATLERLNDRHELGSQYNNFGVLFEMRGDLDSAYHFYKTSLNIKREFNDSLGIPYSLNNMALVKLLSGDTTGVYALIKQAFDIRTARHDRYGMAENKTIFGEYFLAAAKFAEAEMWLIEAIADCSELNLPYQNQINFETLAKVHAGTGNYREALAATERAQAIKDSLFNESNAKVIFELEKKFDLAGKEKENAELIAKNTRQTMVLYLTIALVTVLALLAFVFVQRAKRKAREQRDALIIAEREAGLAAVIEATEEERKRLAKELHDGVGQQLSGLKLAMSRLSAKLADRIPEEAPMLEKINNVLDEAATDVRTISHTMMPKSLQESGLVPSMDDMLRKSLGLSEIEYRFEHFNAEDRRFDPKIEVGVYRICQELINNIIKHAQARFVSVQLFVTGGRLILIVEDNGRGFRTEPDKSGIGLRNIASRLNTLNGEVNYEPGPESGTVATVRILLT